MPGIQIVGAGNNRAVSVSDEGRLRSSTINIQPEYHINFEHESAFVIQTNVTPSPSANFFYVKNASDDIMVLENLEIYSENIEVITLYRNPSGIPTGGIVIEPSNSNFGSSKTADGTFLYGEDLGGLTGGNQHARLNIIAGQENKLTFRNWIIMPKNSSMMLKCKNGNSELDITLPFFYLIGAV